MAKVLLVDDEQGIRETLGRFLRRDGHEVYEADSTQSALAVVESVELDVVVSDVVMPGPSGIDLLGLIRERRPGLKVIIITGEPTVDSAATALRFQAFDYLTKPVNGQLMQTLVRHAAELKAAEDQNRRWQEELEEKVLLRTRQLDSYSKRLRQIADSTSQLLVACDLPEFGTLILRLLATTMAAEGGSFYKRSGTVFLRLATLDATHQNVAIDLPPPENSVLARLLREGTGFFMPDIRRDEGSAPSGWDGYRDGSFLVLPGYDAQGQINLVITLHNKRVPPFTAEDLELAKLIGTYTQEAFGSLQGRLALAESERKFRLLVEETRDVVFCVSPRGIITYCSPAISSFGGYDHEEVELGSIRRYVTDLAEVPHILRLAEEACESGRSIRAEFLFRPKKGVPFPVEVVGKPVFAQEDLIGFNCSMRDISQRQQIEMERRKLEEQLAQARKMESIGRLAGGIAHDFNNQLTGISGHCELALMKIKPGDTSYEHLKEIAKAANSAAALTRQLLTFSRKQMIMPKVLDLNGIIVEIQKLIRRLIGENITLEFDLAPDLGRILVDPNQTEQILVNLAVNARDAMPSGGRLRIGTSMVNDAQDDRKPSRHVRLSVSDTGCGMNEEVRMRVFEPFFTTKETGKGTGLGLTTVFGAVTQSAGTIEVRSSLGQGTEVTIDWPEAFGEIAVQKDPVAPALRWGTEHIYLVEDEEMVRDLAVKMLSSLGYRVSAFVNGESAIQGVMDGAGPIDLLLSDMVMPGMDGQTLAASLRQLQPTLKVLFTSGYSESPGLLQGVREGRIHFIAKPYSLQTLSAKLREVLDRRD